MAEQKGQVPAWAARRAVENKAQIEELVQTYRSDWGRPSKPLLADAHTLLDDEYIAGVLTGHPKRRAERALIELLRQEVRRQLSAGKLVAEGLRNPADYPVPIPAEQWPLLQVDFDGSEASLASGTIAGIRVRRSSAAIGAVPLGPAAPSAVPVETRAQRRVRAKRELAEWAPRYLAAESAAGRKVDQRQFCKDAQKALAPLEVTRQMARDELRKHGTLKPGEKTGRPKSPN
ncbi:MAG: hypothetical protein ACLPSW_29960 [Roseiarcus sp.]